MRTSLAITVIALAFFSSYGRAQSSRPSLPRPGMPVPLPAGADTGPPLTLERLSAEAVADHYLTQAHGRYQDSLGASKRLFESLKELITTPSEETHAAAKASWLEAHRIYSRTEVFRFGNPNVDAWETRVNAWPVDEGFLDYVSPAYVYEGGNPHALFNLIASDFQIAPSFILEARSEMDPKAGVYRGFTDNETNVATGFHAIEFLLWGQDLNGSPRSAGGRPHTDFIAGDSGTGGNAKRRGEYLLALGGILIADLLDAVHDWDPGNPILYSREFRELPVAVRLDRMILGMGGLANAELAGERIQVALLAGDQEEEQSCFSDTTHWALLENAICIETLYLGMESTDEPGRAAAVSLSSLVAKLDPALDARLKKEFGVTRAIALSVAERAEKIEPFDQMILFENAEGRALLNEWIAALKTQTETLERIRGKVGDLATIH